MSDYRRPGVYLEESLQTSPTQGGTAATVAVFAGVAPKGDANVAVRIDSWADYVQKFGGFDTITLTDGTAPAVNSTVISYLPYAVFAYYQNGGRGAYVVRVLPTATGNGGAIASKAITDGVAAPDTGTAFTATATGVGAWGDDLELTIIDQATDGQGNMIFGIIVRNNGIVVETFNNLSMNGVQGTRPVVSALNDPLSGSRFVALAPGTAGIEPDAASFVLTGGANPGTPTAADLVSTGVVNAMRQIEQPVMAAFQPFRKQDGTFVMPPAASLTALNADRNNVFTLWDGNPLAAAGSNYTTDFMQRAANIGTADSYAAIYGPWIIVPDPARPGATIAVPPSGSVAGMISRLDATVGVWRAPAGMPAVLSTAVGVELKFTDTDQGQLNFNNVNVIKPVVGAGVCVMGARTRKLYGPDRYVNDRRVLIYVEEALKQATQYAVFDNNDSRLWSSLRSTAANILRPLWERGGLAGNSQTEAYFITCDSTINTPQVVQSGEVRMEVGVALQYPAEFVIIRISQFDSGASASELAA